MADCFLHDGEEYRAGTINYNGEDVSVEALFAGGIVQHMDPNELDFDDYDAYDDDELDGGETDEDGTATENPRNQPSFRDILEERPPYMADALKDELFTEVTDDKLVKKKILQRGNGIKIAPEGKVWFHYVAFCNDDEKPYDSTLSRRPHTCTLEPPGELIPGLRLGVKTMEINEIAQIVVHYSYGYGKLGAFPRIPGKATLMFNVKMMNSLPIEKLHISQLNIQDRQKLQFTEVLQAANKFRTVGNSRFSQISYRKAIRCYRSGIDLLEQYMTDNEADNFKRCETLSGLYLNLAKSYLLLGTPEPCCVACKNGLELKFGSLKGSFLFTFARAKFLLASFDHALDILKRARKHYENKDKLDKLEAEIREKQKKQAKAQAQINKLMGKANDKGDNDDGTSGSKNKVGH